MITAYPLEGINTGCGGMTATDGTITFCSWHPKTVIFPNNLHIKIPFNILLLLFIPSHVPYDNL